MSNDVFFNLAMGMVICLAVVAVVTGLIIATDLPEVHRSWSTDECIAVYPPDAATCDDLPSTYISIWVK